MPTGCNHKITGVLVLAGWLDINPALPQALGSFHPVGEPIFPPAGWWWLAGS